MVQVLYLVELIHGLGKNQGCVVEATRLHALRQPTGLMRKEVVVLSLVFMPASMRFGTLSGFRLIGGILDLVGGEIMPRIMVLDFVRAQCSVISVEVFLEHTLEVVVCWILILDRPGSLDTQKGDKEIITLHCIRRWLSCLTRC